MKKRNAQQAQIRSFARITKQFSLLHTYSTSFCLRGNGLLLNIIRGAGICHSRTHGKRPNINLFRIYCYCHGGIHYACKRKGNEMRPPNRRTTTTKKGIINLKPIRCMYISLKQVKKRFIWCTMVCSAQTLLFRRLRTTNNMQFDWIPVCTQFSWVQLSVVESVSIDRRILFFSP